MTISNIYLHPEVKDLMSNMCIHNPEEYAVNIIKSKDQKAPKNFQPNLILKTLIGDSFDVTFKGPTNNGRNYDPDARLKREILGTVIANVAPNLGIEKDFQPIFFGGKNYNSLPKAIQDFYQLGNNDTEYIVLPQTLSYFNKTAYKKHFRIWAENNVQAARLHNRRTIVLPGMGLGIYAGELYGKVQDLGILGNIQFEVLKEIAQSNTDLIFTFHGLGISEETSKIQTSDIGSLEGRACNDSQPMIDIIDDKHVLRCVAGSLDYPLGLGSGDNGQIAHDTDANEVRKRIDTYNVHVGNVSKSFQVNTEQESNTGKLSAKELSSTLQEKLSEYCSELKNIVSDVKTNDVLENDYVGIKSYIRVLKARDFSRFNDKDQHKFQNLINAEKELLDALYQARDETNPSFIRQIIEFIKDVWSWMTRSFSDNRKWANSIAKDHLNTSCDL